MQVFDWLRKITRYATNPFANYVARVVVPVGITALVLLTPLTINNFLQGRTEVGLAILFAQVLLLVDVLALRRGKQPPIHYGLLVVPMIIAMLAAVVYQGIIGALWGFPVVLIYHFVLSRRLAFLFSIGILATLTFAVARWIDPALAVRIFATLLLTIVMINIVLNVIGELQDALRQQAERLKLERDRLELILKTAQDGFWLVNASTGHIVDVNDASSSMLGYPREELLTLGMTDIDAQWTPEEIGREMQKAKTVGSALFETRHHAKGGQIIDVEASVNYTPVTDQFFLFIRNITSRKRVEQELTILAEIGRVIGSTLNIDEVYERVTSEVKKLIPFDRLHVNLHSLDTGNAMVAYVSGVEISKRRKGDLFPLKGSVSEILIKTRAGLLSDVTEDNATQAGMRSLIGVPLISRGEVFASLHLRSNKQYAYAEQELRLAERIGEQIAGAISNAQMFKDLSNVERSLRESEERFRTLVEQAPVGVAEIEVSTNRFITVNRNLCEMVGMTEKELLATTFHAITHPEDISLDEEKRALLLAGKIGHYTREKRYLRKDGGIIWVNITISHLRASGRKPERNMIVVENITERKRAEEEIREMSLRDLLTDLYNRRGFITLAEHQIRAADRDRRLMLLMFVDCDGLKGINDTLGHEEGDRALIDTANVLRQTFRKSDIIARLGGDEFAVLSIDAADMNPEYFPKRLQQNIDVYNAKKARPYKLAMSWGMAVYDPGSPLSLDELMSSADERMYAQKKTKPNRRT